MLPLLALAVPSLAATSTVAPDGSGDHEIIQAAIDAASSGDTIEVGAGTQVECLDPGGKDLVIVGAGEDVVFVDPAGACEPALALTSGERLSLSGLSITNSGLPCIQVSDSELVLDQATVSGCGTTTASAAVEGGALAVSGGSATLRQVIMQDNRGRGGAVFGERAALTTADSSFTGNGGDEVDYGGAIWARETTLELDGCELSANTAARGSSIHGEDVAVSTTECNITRHARLTAVVVEEGGSWTDLGSSITLNEGTALDLAGWGSSTMAVELQGTTASGNSTVLELAHDTTLSMTDCDFSDNAVALTYDSSGEPYAFIEDSSFTGHSAQAIYMDAGSSYDAGSIELSGSSFSDKLGGVSLYLEDTGGIRVSDCSFSDTSGSALAIRYADEVAPTGNRFTGNRGGATWDLNSEGSETWVNHVFLGNSAPYGGCADGNITDEPLFVEYSADGDCSNDDLSPAAGSPLVDAGNPDILDEDGTVSDIGLLSDHVLYGPDEDGGASDGGSAEDGGSTDGGSAEDGGSTDGGSAEDGGASDGGSAEDGGSTDGGSAKDGGSVEDGGGEDGGSTDGGSVDDGGEDGGSEELEGEDGKACTTAPAPAVLAWLHLPLVLRRRRALQR